MAFSALKFGAIFFYYSRFDNKIPKITYLYSVNVILSNKRGLTFQDHPSQNSLIT